MRLGRCVRLSGSRGASIKHCQLSQFENTSTFHPGFVQEVKLLEDDEHTILARIRYPDVEAAANIFASHAESADDEGPAAAAAPPQQKQLRFSMQLPPQNLLQAPTPAATLKDSSRGVDTANVQLTQHLSELSNTRGFEAAAGDRVSANANPIKPSINQEVGASDEEETWKPASNKRLIIGIASMARPGQEGRRDNDLRRHDEATEAEAALMSNSSYLLTTLQHVIGNLDRQQRRDVLVLVTLTDRNATLLRSRSQRLMAAHRRDIAEGVLKVVVPPHNIYPLTLFEVKAKGQAMIKRLPYGNSRQRSRWQSKLALDFAYLFSCARAISQQQQLMLSPSGGGDSTYFINFEDDVKPTQPNYVNAILDYTQEQNRYNPHWSSLLFSAWLSIGRLFRVGDLAKVVDLICIAYNKQPVDYILSHFDMIQMADRYREFRRKPPLLQHIGNVSTMSSSLSKEESPQKGYHKGHDVSGGDNTAAAARRRQQQLRAAANVKLNRLKASNPAAAVVSTNMTQWLDHKVSDCYFPPGRRGPSPSNQTDDQTLLRVFWAKNFVSGDVVDVRLLTPVTGGAGEKVANVIKSVQVATGFGSTEERWGDDAALEADILLSKDCRKFVSVPEEAFKNRGGGGGNFQFNLKWVTNSKAKMMAKNVKCVRFKVCRGQSDWLRIRLFHIRI